MSSNMPRTASIVTAVVLVSCNSAFAADTDEQNGRQEYRRGNFFADLAVGVMNGKANELVFGANGAVISKLKWKYDNNIMLSGDINLSPFHRFTIGLRGRTNLTSNSTMDDFDFPGSVCGLTGPYCQSHHESTTLRNAARADLYMSYETYRTERFKLSGIAGYRWDYFEWDASGGTSNYAPPFPDVSVIAYRQWWEAPYLGFQAAGQWEKLSLQGRVIGSFAAQGHDRDDHKLRSLLFTDDFRRSEMVSTNVKIGYNILPRTSVTISWDYDRWFTAKGPTVVWNYATGVTNSYAGEAAGASSEAHTVSVGLQYKF